MMKRTNSFLMFLGISLLLIVVLSSCGLTSLPQQPTLPSPPSSVDLAVSAGQTTPLSYDPGSDELSTEIVIENLGAADEDYTLNIATQDTSSGGIYSLIIYTEKFLIPKGNTQKKTITPSQKISATYLPGTYDVVASVDVLGDIDTSNNQVTLGSFTIDANGDVTIP